MISKCRFSLPRLDITGMWVFALGVWFHIVARLVYSKPWMAFFLAELIEQTHQPEQKSRLPAGSASATAGRLTWPTGRWCCLCRGIALTVTSLTRY